MLDELPPQWFRSALETPAEEGFVSVDGARIAYRAWGEPTGRDLVLIHGGAAHARWWDHIGPLLAARRGRVVAVDLSGHGDSDRRPEYHVKTWAREVLAVAEASGIDAPPTLLGASMGGFVALEAAASAGASLRGAIVVDSPLRQASPEEVAARQRRAFGALKVYASPNEALARFRLIPEHPVLPYVLAHVASASLRAVPGGWSWKFDPRIFSRPLFTAADVERVLCRVAVFRAEHGILTAESSDIMYERLGRLAPVVEIPDAGHHVMLDQPLALVTGVRTLLSDWDHSLPVPAR